MEYSFQTNVKLTAEHTPGEAGSKHKATDFLLEVSDNLDKSKYFDDGLPNAEGSKIVTQVLVQGLVANMSMAHQLGFRDSAEHFRYILSELERGFVEVAHISTDIWEESRKTGGSKFTPPKKRRS